jgi:hypothetical protein
MRPKPTTMTRIRSYTRVGEVGGQVRVGSRRVGERRGVSSIRRRCRCSGRRAAAARQARDPPQSTQQYAWHHPNPPQRACSLGAAVICWLSCRLRAETAWGPPRGSPMPGGGPRAGYAIAGAGGRDGKWRSAQPSLQPGASLLAAPHAQASFWGSGALAAGRHARWRGPWAGRSLPGAGGQPARYVEQQASSAMRAASARVRTQGGNAPGDRTAQSAAR